MVEIVFCLASTSLCTLRASGEEASGLTGCSLPMLCPSLFPACAGPPCTSACCSRQCSKWPRRVMHPRNVWHSLSSRCQVGSLAASWDRLQWVQHSPEVGHAALAPSLLVRLARIQCAAGLAAATASPRRPSAAGPPSPLRIAVPKNAVNTSLLGLSPTELFYVRQSVQGSGSGLSSGAIAGIAVGSCAAAAALAVAAWLALRRRQRRWQQQLPPLGIADGDKQNTFTASSNSGGLANGSAQTSVARTSAAAQPCGGAAGGAAEGGAIGSAAEGGGSSGYSATPAGGPPGSLPPLPPMRAGWNARAAPSPFAADASTPFGSSSGGAATPLQVGSASGAATPGANRSRHHGSASRSHSLVQAIPAAEAEAAAAAAYAATVAAPTTCSAPVSSSHASSEETLPELVQHVAQCDAVQSLDPAGAAAAVEQHALMSIDSLPPILRVRDWWLGARRCPAGSEGCIAVLT